ncbi:protein prenylyltransferase [Xylariaceae sp. FL0255]|nr:protein prenylyltransferase [Xylariaceae sp. FL0255]
MDNHGIARGPRTARTQEQRTKDLAKIDKYRQLDDQIRAASRLQSYPDPALFDLTSKLLRLNPEYYTTWNVRRRCLTSGFLSKPSPASLPSSLPTGTTTSSSETCSPSSSSAGAIPPSPDSRMIGQSVTIPDDHDEDNNQKNDANILKSELAFTIPLLLEFPKCYWIWKYRKWLLEEAILRLPRALASEIWQGELALDSKMLVKDSRNFHAWGYRRYLVARLESPDLLHKSLAEEEFTYTTKMIKANLSNFSAWHNRSRLMHRVLDERGADDKARAAFLDDEFAAIQNALNCGPEDQSLWYYDRFLISQVVGEEGKPTITPNLTNEEKIKYLEDEIEFIKDLLEDYPDIKWPYEALIDYALALGGLSPESKAERDGHLRSWLATLRKLDPMLSGRWNDFEQQLNSSNK